LSLQSKNGIVYYVNTDTGEEQESEPESLYIAKAMRKVEDAENLLVEHKKLQTKYKDLEMKKREADLIANKAKTEMNSLRSVDKNWRESAKTVYLSINNMKNVFESQCDQAMNTLSAVAKVTARVQQKTPLVVAAKLYVAELQAKNRKLESLVGELSAKIRYQTIELEEKQSKIDRLSHGLDEEIERLTRPMREKLSECMTMVMKEKANRAQERRDLAALWPEGADILPSILMKYRDLTDDERERRLNQAKQKSANLALSLEVRANINEKKKWELKYDDYGRTFYQHQVTGEVNWDPPEILSYEPPPGRDEDGNLIEEPAEQLHMWVLETNNRGEVFFKHKSTGEVTFSPPYFYPKIPKGKSTDDIVSEAASIVLKYIKTKISSHIKRMSKVQQDALNPLTPEEKRRKEKEEKNKARFEVKSEDPPDKVESNDDDSDDLSAYLYDIETVEMIASRFEKKKTDPNNPEAARQEERKFMEGQIVRNFDVGLYSGPTLHETDVSAMTIDNIRAIVEHLSICEEKLDLRLKRTRTNLKDFSNVLLENIRQYQREKLAEQNRIEKEKRLLEKQRKKEEKEEAKRRKKRDRENLKNVDDGVDEMNDPNGMQLLSPGDDSASEDNDKKRKKPSKDLIDGAGGLIEDANILDEEGVKTESIKGNEVDSDDDDDDDDGDDESDQDLEEVEQVVEVNTSSAESIIDDDASIKFELGTLLVGDPDMSVDDREYTQDIVKMSTQLVNLSLYCGYTNSRLDECPDLTTSDELVLNPEFQNKTVDDKWLTASFYIANTKERIDAIRELIRRPYDPMLGLLNATPVETQRLMFDGLRQFEDGAGFSDDADLVCISKLFHFINLSA